MSRFEHLIFICQHEREPGDTRGSCHTRGAAVLLDRVKELVAEHKLKGRVRVTSSGCLDFCKHGINAVVFSADPARAETWYSGLSPDDAGELFEAHVLGGGRLERAVQTFAKATDKNPGGKSER